MQTHDQTSIAPGRKPAHATSPSRIGILNDYVRVPFANGSSFASQFLFREFSARGHHVSVIGPSDPELKPSDLPPDCVTLASGPVRAHPGLRMPLPTRQRLREVESRNLDVVIGQASSELIDLGVWLKARRGVPFLPVNTLHLPSYYQVILPDHLYENRLVKRLFDRGVMPWLEGHCASVYNQGDGLIVLAKGFERYWRERGVKVPIHVIPRAIDRSVFDAPAAADPFDPRAKPGQRLLCLCRHSREKGLRRLIEIFARYIAPNVADATLTLAGDGPDQESFKEAARELGVAERVFFPGEISLQRVVDYYRHADVFVYNSLSETYGQVVSEAQYCGLPVVAFEDGMGVSGQISSGEDGVLIAPGPNRNHANFRFGAEVVGLLRHPTARLNLGAQARRSAALRCDTDRVIQRYYDAFKDARQHCSRTWQKGRRYTQVASIARWSVINSIVISLGVIRPEVTLNRLNRAQPNWSLKLAQLGQQGQQAQQGLPHLLLERRERDMLADAFHAQP